MQPEKNVFARAESLISQIGDLAAKDESLLTTAFTQLEGLVRGRRSRPVQAGELVSDFSPKVAGKLEGLLKTAQEGLKTGSLEAASAAINQANHLCDALSELLSALKKESADLRKTTSPPRPAPRTTTRDLPVNS